MGWYRRRNKIKNALLTIFSIRALVNSMTRLFLFFTAAL